MSWYKWRKNVAMVSNLDIAMQQIRKRHLFLSIFNDDGSVKVSIREKVNIWHTVDKFDIFVISIEFGFWPVMDAERTQVSGNTTMMDSDSVEEGESGFAQYYYYAFFWKSILLLWDLSGVVVQVRQIRSIEK